MAVPNSNPAAGIWQRLASPFREFGALAGALYVIDRLLRRLSPHLGLFVYELMVQPITDEGLLPSNLSKNLRFTEIERGDPAVGRMPARDDIKALRYERGIKCLGVYRKDQLIGYIWLCFGTYPEDEVRCDYVLTAPECSVFDFDLYVFPEHRLGLGFMAVWHGANQYLRERGIRYTFSRLTRFNVASRRAHAHLGWRWVGRAVFLQLRAVEVMFASLPPYVSLTRRPSQRVRMALSPDVLDPP